MGGSVCILNTGGCIVGGAPASHNTGVGTACEYRGVYRRVHLRATIPVWGQRVNTGVCTGGCTYEPQYRWEAAWDDCLPPRDTSPHQDSTGTALSGTPPPIQRCVPGGTPVRHTTSGRQRVNTEVCTGGCTCEAHCWWEAASVSLWCS